jgi:hypothetical protein
LLMMLRIVFLLPHPLSRSPQFLFLPCHWNITFTVHVAKQLCVLSKSISNILLLFAAARQQRHGARWVLFADLFFLNFFLLWPHRRLCYINHKVLLLPHQPNTRGDDRNTLRVHRRLRIPQPLLLHTPHFGTARTFKRNTQQVRRSPPQTPRAHLFFLFVLWCASVFLFFALVLIHLLICIPFLFYTYFRPKNILDVLLMVFS